MFNTLEGLTQPAPHYPSSFFSISFSLAHSSLATLVSLLCLQHIGHTAVSGHLHLFPLLRTLFPPDIYRVIPSHSYDLCSNIIFSMRTASSCYFKGIPLHCTLSSFCFISQYIIMWHRISSIYMFVFVFSSSSRL